MRRDLRLGGIVTQRRREHGSRASWRLRIPVALGAQLSVTTLMNCCHVVAEDAYWLKVATLSGRPGPG